MASQVRTQSVTTGYVALPDLSAAQVSILNNTGADILIRMASETDTGEEITLADGQSVALRVVANAKEVQIKAAGAASGVQIVID